MVAVSGDGGIVLTGPDTAAIVTARPARGRKWAPEGWSISADGGIVLLTVPDKDS
jgi:hypothetical protein